MLGEYFSFSGRLPRKKFATRIIPIMALRLFLSSRQGAMLAGGSGLALWAAFAAGYLTLWLKYATINRCFEALGRGPVWTVALFLLTRNFLRKAAAGTPFAAVLWAAALLELGVIVYLLLKGDAAQAGPKTAAAEEPELNDAAPAGPRTAEGERPVRSEAAQEVSAGGGAASDTESETISFARSTPLREKLKREAREQTSESDIMYFAYAIGVMAFMQEPLNKIFPRLDYRDCSEKLESERINLYFHVYFSLVLLVHAKRFAKGDRALERNIAVLLSACRARFIADYLSVYDEDEEAVYAWDEAAYNEYFDRAEKDTGKDYARFEQALRMIMVSDIVDNYLKTDNREVRASLLAYASAFAIMRMPRVCGMMETFFLKADTIAEEIGLLREE